MATSIFPDVDSAAGTPIRDDLGNCLNPPDVQNAYCPPPTYLTTCPITALPSDCDARIEPRQINAIVSELVAFAECLDPNGPWDCSSLKNLCTAFTSWATQNIVPIHVGDTPPADPGLNQLWWETDSGALFIWYDDGTSQQWVQIGGSIGVFVDGISIVGEGDIVDPYRVGLVDCGTW